MFSSQSFVPCSQQDYRMAGRRIERPSPWFAYLPWNFGHVFCLTHRKAILFIFLPSSFFTRILHSHIISEHLSSQIRNSIPPSSSSFLHFCFVWSLRTDTSSTTPPSSFLSFVLCYCSNSSLPMIFSASQNFLTWRRATGEGRKTEPLICTLHILFLFFLHLWVPL